MANNELKEALKQYKSNQFKVQNLIKKNELLETQKNTVIEGQKLKASAITDMPKSPIDGLKETSSMMIDVQDEEYLNLIGEQTFVKKDIEELNYKISLVDDLFRYLKENNMLEEYNFLYLRYIKNMEIIQIADEKNMSQGSVYNRINCIINNLT